MARILLVTNDFPPRSGGIQSYLENLVGGLVKTGTHTLTVYAPKWKGCEAFDANENKAARKRCGDFGKPSESLAETKAERSRKRRRSGRLARWSFRKHSHCASDAATEEKSGQMYPARLQDCPPGVRSGAGRRRPERIACPRPGTSSGLGDRREARMPLPARVEHAAETRQRDPSGSGS